MNASLKWMACAWVALGAAGALAEPDSFGLGTGKDGALRVTAPGTRINAYAGVTWPLAPGDTLLRVTSTEGFGQGDLVMVLQTTGIVPEPASGISWPVDLGNDPVGRWEFARVAVAREGKVLLTAPLASSYAASVTQLIRVPEYTTVRIETGGSLVAAPWDGSTGGVLAFLATGDIANDGQIDVSGAGFRGGLYVRDATHATGCLGLQDDPPSLGAQKGEGVASTRYGVADTGAGNVANGGGGGVCQRSGGGGGGNAGPGGQGGRSLGTDGAREVGGLGGAMLAYSLLDHLTFGGGGGAGHGNAEPGLAVPDGGAGGGIIFIRGGGRLLGQGSILARGGAGGNSLEEGAGGGGAGGSISLRLADTVSCGLISASGGAGGSTALAQVGPGGGGGGGRVLFQAASSRDCPRSAIDVRGGVAGQQPDGLAEGGPAFGAEPSAANGAFYGGSVTVLPGGFAVPPAPLMTTPPGSKLEGGQAITGVAMPNATVVLYLDGVEAGRAVADASGRYSFTLPRYLPSGPHRLQVATVSQGVLGPRSTPLTVRIRGAPIEAMLPLALNSQSSTPTCVTTTATTTIKYGPCNQFISGDALFLITSTATAPVYYNCGMDILSVSQFSSCPGVPGVPNAALYHPRELPTPTEGLHVFYAGDTSGLLQTCSTCSFTLDMTPPVITLISKPSDPSNDLKPSFSFNAKDDLSPTMTFKCRIYPLGTSAPFGTCSTGSVTGSGPYLAPGSYSPTIAGPKAAVFNTYVFDVMATDAAGNSSLASYEWTVVTKPIVVTINDPKPPSPTGATSALFVFSATASMPVTFQCRHYLTTATTAPGFAPCSGLGWDYEPTISSGPNQFDVQATDAAGNTSNTASYQWTVDSTTPSIQLDSPCPEVSNQPLPGFAFSSPSNATLFQCQLDSSPFNGCTSPYQSLAKLVDGPHTFEVRAETRAGVVSPPAVCSWTLDTVPPNITKILAGSSIQQDPVDQIWRSNDPLPTFMFYADKSGVTYECRLDAQDPAPFQGCSDPVTFPSPFVDDPHTLYVRATDPAGNVSPVASFTWTLSTRKPQPPVVTSPGPEAFVGTGTPQIQGTVEEGGTVALSIDGSPAGTVTVNAAGGWSFTPVKSIARGHHAISATLTNVFKNTSDASTSTGFTVDEVLPTTQIVSGPEGTVAATDATFEFSSNKVGATFEYSLNGSPFAPCPDGDAEHCADGKTLVLHDLGEGSYTLVVRAKDETGRVDQNPPSRSWKVYLGKDSRALGGGLSCSAPGGGASLTLLALVLARALGLRRRR